MFSSLPSSRQQELEQLAHDYGQPLVRTIDLNVNHLFDPLSRRDNRLGEVCMVVRRPNGHLLTMKKTFYPPDGYRLMTGGITKRNPSWTHSYAKPTKKPAFKSPSTVSSSQSPTASLPSMTPPSSTPSPSYLTKSVAPSAPSTKTSV